jgi:hypothetical protein
MGSGPGAYLVPCTMTEPAAYGCGCLVLVASGLVSLAIVLWLAYAIAGALLR